MPYDVPQVGVVGGTDFKDRERLFRFMDEQHTMLGDMIVITGDAEGTETLVAAWAEERGVPFLVYPSDDTIEVEGEQMKNPNRHEHSPLIAEDSSFMIAFFNGFSKGTRDIIQLAKRLGRRVITVEYR